MIFLQLFFKNTNLKNNFAFLLKINRRVNLPLLTKNLRGCAGCAPTTFLEKFKGGAQGAHPSIFLFKLSGGQS